MRGADGGAGRSLAGFGLDVDATGAADAGLSRGCDVDAMGRAGDRDRDRLRDAGAEELVGRETNDEWAGASELSRDDDDAASDASVRDSRSSFACSCVCAWS